MKLNVLPTLFACKEKNIQSQIVESIIIIAAVEFPDSWPTLLDVSTHCYGIVNYLPALIFIINRYLTLILGSFIQNGLE